MAQLFRRAALALTCAMVIAATPAWAESVPASPAPSVLTPTAVDGSSAPTPTQAGLSAALAPSLKALRTKAKGVVIIDPATSQVLFESQGDSARTPASTIKLLTAAAALTVLGPDARITTKVAADDPTAKVVTLTLIGAGDATLSRAGKGGTASLANLAAQAAEAVPVGEVVLQFDDSAFSGPVLAPGWPKRFPAAGIVAPVTALMVDQGRVRPGASARVADPAAQAAKVFASFLGDHGLVVRSVKRGRAAQGATDIASVQSPVMSTLVQRMLTDSDNDLAEAIGHLVGGANGGTASFASGGKAVLAATEDLGIPTEGSTIVDGSGLSGRDKVSAHAIASVLALAASGSNPAVSLINPGLAVAGLTGTLADRFDAAEFDAAAGYVHAKTGTLTGVVSLAGQVRDADGRVLVFAVLANKVKSTAGARVAVDRFAASVAACGCR